MDHLRFEEPITILVGMGFPTRVETVMDAYALLRDWAAGRNSAHTIALNACRAGIAGEVDVETVRATLEAFARRNDILISDTVSPMSPTYETASVSRVGVTPSLSTLRG